MLHFSLFFLSISGIKARWLLNEAGGDPWCDCRGAQQHRSAEKSFFPEHLQSICERRGGRAIERRDHRDGEKKVGTKEKVHHGFINPERERERERGTAHECPSRIAGYSVLTLSAPHNSKWADHCIMSLLWSEEPGASVKWRPEERLVNNTGPLRAVV